MSKLSRSCQKLSWAQGSWACHLPVICQKVKPRDKNRSRPFQTMVVLVSEGSGTSRTPVRHKWTTKLTWILKPEHLREASDEHEPCTNPTTQVRPMGKSSRRTDLSKQVPVTSAQSWAVIGRQPVAGSAVCMWSILRRENGRNSCVSLRFLQSQSSKNTQSTGRKILGNIEFIFAHKLKAVTLWTRFYCMLKWP